MLLAGNIGQPASTGPAGRAGWRGVGVGTGLGVDDGLGAGVEIGVALGATVGCAVDDGSESAKIRVGCGPVWERSSRRLEPVRASANATITPNRRRRITAAYGPSPAVCPLRVSRSGNSPVRLAYGIWIERLDRPIQ